MHRRSVHKAGSSGNINEAGTADTGAQDDGERIQEEEDDEMDRQRKDSKEEYVFSCLFLKFILDRGPFCKTTGTLCFGFRMSMPMSFKARVDSSLPMLF